MKRGFSFVVIAICCAGVLACQPGGAGLTDQDKAAIRQLDDTFSKAVTSDKPDWDTALAAYYADDAKWMMPNMPVAEGRAAIKAVFSQFPPVKDFKLTEVSLEGGGDVAYRHYAYEMTMAVPGAPAPVTDKGNGIEIFKRQADGTWKVIRDIGATVLPPPGLNVPTGSMAADATPELKKLAEVVGRWQFVGTFKADPKATAGPVDLTLTCDWFAGGRQVVYRFSGKMLDAQWEELGFYAYDQAAKTFVFYGMMNDGTAGPGKVAIQPGSWIHTQDIQVGGKPAKSRFMLADMTTDGGSWKYEVSAGGAPWAVLGEGKYTKAK
jgi:ketosteroid isomerase-like protein